MAELIPIGGIDAPASAPASIGGLSIAALSSGAIVQASVQSDTTLALTVADRNGFALASTSVVSSGPLSRPDVVGLSGGGFVLGWTVQNAGARGFDVVAQLFDATARPTSGLLTLSAATDLSQRNVQLAALPGGGFVAAWEQSGDAAAAGVRARVFAADGTPASGELTLAGANADRTLTDLVGLGNGGFVAATFAAGGGDSRASVFGAGAQAVAEVVLATGISELAATATGFVAAGGVVTGGGAGQIGTLRTQAFSFDGAAAGPISTASSGLAIGPVELQTLANGSLVAAFGGAGFYLDAAGRQTGQFVIGTQFFYQANSIPSTFLDSVEVAPLPGDGFVLSADVRTRFSSLASYSSTLYLPLVAGTNDSDRFVGSDALDLYAGGAGADTLIGAGNSDYFRGEQGDDALFGGPGRDRLFGGAGADYLDGGDDEDVLEGGEGDDIYVIASGDTILEASGAGFDRVIATSTATLSPFGAEVEALQLADAQGIESYNLYGNGWTQIIVGNYGNNLLADGNAPAGAPDTLVGLRGDDSYFVIGPQTLIREHPGEGFDRLIVTAAAGSFQLNAGAEVERLTAEGGSMIGDANINIAGNGFSQRIEGNAGANILSSGGGGGVDTMAGGLGDDTYRVFATGDVIDDTGGFDTVYASGTSYFLYSTAAVEYLSTSEQAATTPIYLVGNGAAQVIAGNWGDNILNGRGGDGVAPPDTLIGLYGNDTYGVFSQGDVVREVAGQGSDVVYASTSYQLRAGTEIEALAAVNGAASDAYTLRGNEFAQTVVGNAGANTLDGRGGNDTLVGLGGADVFAFTTAPAAGNVDMVQDFAAEDRIGLASDVFAAVTADGIAAGELVLGTAAQDADDRLLYDQATGRLFYDADANGAGAAVLFAQLSPGTALTAASFVAVAPVSDLPGA
jgi:Ca2+-binding RTX toxin-like protein